MNNFALSQPHKNLVRALLLCVFTLFAAYVYFLSASVMHVVVRTEADYNNRELRSQIAELETEFIAVQHAVSQQIASLDGYHDISHKVFVSRDNSSLVLSVNTGR